MISGSTASTSPAASRLFHWIAIVHAPPFVSSIISIDRMLLHSKYLWIINLDSEKACSGLEARDEEWGVTGDWWRVT